VGLNIAAVTAPEIALSILAEVVTVRRAAEPAAAQRRTAVDPVCGMEVAVSPASVQAEIDGERHYFCGDGCRNRFVADRARDAGVS